MTDLTMAAVLAVLGAFVFATAAIKTVAYARGRLAWPDGPNLLRMHIPLGVAVTFEGVAGAAPLLGHQRLAHFQTPHQVLVRDRLARLHQPPIADPPLERWGRGREAA